MADYGVDVAEHDGWAVVAISGSVDLATAPALKERMLDLVTNGREHLVCDLTATEFLDSTAWARWCRVQAVAGCGAGDAAGLHDPSILKVFDITGLNRVFPIHASIEVRRQPRRLIAAPPVRERAQARRRGGGVRTPAPRREARARCRARRTPGQPMAWRIPTTCAKARNTIPGSPARSRNA